MENSPAIVILNLAAAAALLIWAVRFVRTGFERAFGGHFRHWLRRSTGNRFAAAATGAMAAILLQSSTAVAMLLAGFMAAGSIGSITGLAIILGADLGSAIAVQILNSRISALAPLLLLVGVLFFLRSPRRNLRQIGRILIGLALIFISLDLIRTAGAPLSDSGAARSAMIYLSGDLISAFLLAAVFTWLVHTSLAAVLLVATLATQSALTLDAAFAMVLGANLGAGFIAFFLTLAANPSVRRVILGNLLLRGGGALIALPALIWLDAAALIPGASPLHQTLNLHIAFNLMLLVTGMLILRPSMRFTGLILADGGGTGVEGDGRSALDPTVKDQPLRAFTCARRELVGMGNLVEIMLRDAIGLFDSYDDTVAGRLRSEKRNISRISLELRVYLSGVRSGDPKVDTGTRAFDLSGVAVNLETGADVIIRKMVNLAQRKYAEKMSFSDDGWRELSDFHDQVLSNVQHGIAVLMSEDVGLARELVERKEKIREIERVLQRKHLKRLRQGLTDSIDTSAIHIELLHSLKMLNTSFAMIAYPLLRESGELLESRLASD